MTVSRILLSGNDDRAPPICARRTTRGLILRSVVLILLVAAAWFIWVYQPDSTRRPRGQRPARRRHRRLRCSRVLRPPLARPARPPRPRRRALPQTDRAHSSSPSAEAATKTPATPKAASAATTSSPTEFPSATSSPKPTPSTPSSRSTASPQSPHENNLHHIVVVSDGTHLFRIRELCRRRRPRRLHLAARPRSATSSNYDLAMRYFHEILSYTALRLNLNISWLTALARRAIQIHQTQAQDYCSHRCRKQCRAKFTRSFPIQPRRSTVAPNRLSKKSPRDTGCKRCQCRLCTQMYRPSTSGCDQALADIPAHEPSSVTAPSVPGSTLRKLMIKTGCPPNA